MVHLLCCKMKAFWGFFILVVSASVDLNNITITTPFTSVSSENDTVALSTPNASTTDTNSSTLAGTTTSNIVGDSSVTSPNTTTTDRNTAENVGSTATRILKTDNTKRTTERTSIIVETTSRAVPMVCPWNTTGFIVAGAAVFLAVIWSSCLCCWYRRKLSRVKSQYDAERALSMREVNGRKISEVKFSVGKADKEFSSVSRNVHGEDEEPEDRTSDLYDVTDPDYEDADGTKTSKARERSVDEEDSDYDLLNDDDKMKNRESEYACAEFKNSVEDLDNDTYDTTETCNRIICNKKHENCGGKHLAENLSNVNSRDETDPQNQTKEMKADSKVYDQVRTEENREEKNKNSEDQATIKDTLTVENKTTVVNKTAAMDDKTDEDKKTVENMTKVESMATVENQPMIEGKATVTNNTPKEDHASVESKATVNKSMVKNQPSVENQAVVESKATVEDKSTDKNKASVENQATGENQATCKNKAMIEDRVKIEDGALVGDDNGKMDKPCEKTTKSENDNDTKCVTLEYELVKIVQKPNVTQENKQGTPTSV